jgi:hypothetical protein
MTCGNTISQMWSLVRSVLFWMGAKIELENESGGMFLAILPGEGVASEVQLRIEVSGSPGTDIAYLHGATVTVKATDPQVPEPDKYLLDYLAMIEKTFLDRVAARANCLKSSQELTRPLGAEDAG